MQTDTLQNLCVRAALMTLCLEIISSVFEVKFNLPKIMGYVEMQTYTLQNLCVRAALMTLCLEIISSVFKVKFNLPKMGT